MHELIIGGAAATLTTLSFIPQVIRLYRTKDSRSISMTTFLVFGLGVSLWLAYGIIIRDIVIILANAVTIVLTAMIVVMKVLYR
ncbi:MAG: SemiSWEET transporter [Candidatus Omnitrophica bacterium]|nr:SemiSWEET transporter [Candidatus Omnitrophota bacterium]